MVTVINVLVGLRLQNIALIDCLELTFEKGFTVFTGETGAGKSIFLDAIDLLLGGGKTSVNTQLIQSGSKTALIEGCFLKNNVIDKWLIQNDFEIDTEEFFLTRDWKLRDEKWSNRFRLNGVIINKQQIRALRSYLIDFTIQGQMHNFNAFNNQSNWIDQFGSSSIKQSLYKVKSSWENWNKINIQLEELKHQRKISKNQLQEINQFLLDLDNANIDDPLEDAKLEQEQNQLVNGVQLQEGLSKLFSYLKEGEADFPTALEHLSTSIHELKILCNLDNSLSSHLETAINLYSDLDRLNSSLDKYCINLDSNPHRLQEIQERILLLKRIETRYGLPLKDLIIQRNKYRETNLFEKQSFQLEELKKQEEYLRMERDKNNASLTRLRLDVGKRFEEVLMKYLKLLGLVNVKFKVNFIPCKASFRGADEVIFLFSANPDQPLAPLSQIASGGEMSRFLLALKTALSDVDGSSTFIFDEIDSGVSGRISSSIAKLLKELSSHKQVFCVTHQPLVAAIADHHFSVSKSVENGVTRSRVLSLKGFDARKRELAELAGGDFLEATNYAASLLENKAA